MKERMEIKVGILISYDYKYVFNCIERIYNDVDKIVLTLDSNRQTWSGNYFQIEESFFDTIKQMDTSGKISIYEDVFYQEGLSAIEADTRERNMLGQHMGSGGWHLQIDSDEYFIDFKGFINTLRKIEKRYGNKKLVVYCNWATLFKRLPNGYLLIENRKPEKFPVATNYPVYTQARIVRKIKRIRTSSIVIHESWARDENEIKQKLFNWGHRDEINIESYFNLWKAVDQFNCIYIKDFHPTPKRKTWNRLIPIEGGIDHVVEYLKEVEKNQSLFLKIRNYFQGFM